MKYYAGITVGPIVETLSMTSTPAGLWAASHAFSSFAGDICDELQQRGVKVLTLPEGFLVREHRGEHKGIGRYHDRVYFATDAEPPEARRLIDEVREVALKKMARHLAVALGKAATEDAERFLNQYVQFHYVIVPREETEAKGLAKTLADALDAIELSKRNHKDQGQNLFIELFRGKSEDAGNECLKRYPPLADAAAEDGFAIAYGGSGGIALRDLSYIAKGNLVRNPEWRPKRGKTGNYFAIVQADGDNMGHLLVSSKGGDEESCIQAFSELCMAYTADASKAVADFGGAVIFAGGDDLLFLAPVIGAKGETVWELCQRIDAAFKKSFKTSVFEERDLPAQPSISFGVSINYVKFPLYEAFGDAVKQLVTNAKGIFEKDGKKLKNNISIRVLKHSGQASGFAVSLKKDSDTFQKFIALIDAFFKNGDKKAEKNVNVETSEETGAEKGNATDKADRAMHSVIYHLENQRALFNAAMDAEDAEQKVRNAFKNAFDNENQLLGKAQNEAIAALAAAISKDYDASLVTHLNGEKEPCPKPITLTSMLRVAKLLAEGGKARG